MFLAGAGETGALLVACQRDRTDLPHLLCSHLIIIIIRVCVRERETRGLETRESYDPYCADECIKEWKHT